MLKTKVLVSIFLCALFLTSYAQENIKSGISAISRFHFKSYGSLNEYIGRNAVFPNDAFKNTGVLLTGITLDKNGQIINTFTLNSLTPSIDKSIIALLKKTKGHWTALEDTVGVNTIDSIIIPVVFTLQDTEFKIDRSNFKLPIQDEVQLTAMDMGGSQLSSPDYKSTELLLSQYKNLYSNNKFEEAYKIVKELLRREPINTQFYSNLIQLSIMLEDKESACRNFIFVKRYLIKQPDNTITQKANCE